ncbi:hypothetical protein AH04_179 [Erwinia phage AH04]|uniref:Uncharacterized protein n=1 Tax=Erwinia phage AH04 TaxID=2869569 RepID=A0AAE7X0P1_9CAUD|nr:hypothetical protein PQC02_gp135 [Erwinia phage AH04]QZA70654.1 hypothetical protein AH04_179 [Erwinia phage AH04]
MKDIFSPHVREVHITESRKLHLRVTGIGQAIDILSFISASLKILGPKNPEASVVLGEKGCEGTEKVVIYYAQKEKPHHKNVYVVNLSPNCRSATTLIFNEDDVVKVDKRLKQLIRRFAQEVEKVQSRKPTSATCNVNTQMVGRIRPLNDVNVTKLIGEPMECRDGRYYPSKAYLHQRVLVLGRKKESE